MAQFCATANPPQITLLLIAFSLGPSMAIMNILHRCLVRSLPFAGTGRFPTGLFIILSRCPNSSELVEGNASVPSELWSQLQRKLSQFSVQTPSTGLWHPSFNHCRISYAIGPSKLSANEQFFVGAQTVVSLLQTTQIISGICFMLPCCLHQLK